MTPAFSTLDEPLAHSPYPTDADAVFWEPQWFLPSPDPDTGLTQYIQQFQNCMGLGDALAYQLDVQHGTQVVKGRPAHSFMSSSPSNNFPKVNFVGVIDG